MGWKWMFSGLSMNYCYPLLLCRRYCPISWSPLQFAESLCTWSWSSLSLLAGRSWVRGSVKDRCSPGIFHSFLFAGCQCTCPSLRPRWGRFAFCWSVLGCRLHRFQGNSYQQSKLVRVCLPPYVRYRSCRCVCRQLVLEVFLSRLWNRNSCCSEHRWCCRWGFFPVCLHRIATLRLSFPTRCLPCTLLQSFVSKHHGLSWTASSPSWRCTCCCHPHRPPQLLCLPSRFRSCLSGLTFWSAISRVCSTYLLRLTWSVCRNLWLFDGFGSVWVSCLGCGGWRWMFFDGFRRLCLRLRFWCWLFRKIIRLPCRNSPDIWCW